MRDWKYRCISFGLDTRWRWVVTLTPWPHYVRSKSFLYPLDRKLIESVWTLRRREELLAPAGNRAPAFHPAVHRCFGGAIRNADCWVVRNFHCCWELSVSYWPIVFVDALYLGSSACRVTCSLRLWRATRNAATQYTSVGYKTLLPSMSV
jgi:hypothetical protein